MKKFDIYAVHSAFYIVKAENEEEAKKLVLNGEVESVEVGTEIAEVIPIESS